MRHPWASAVESEGGCSRCVIPCVHAHLRFQWAIAAARCGGVWEWWWCCSAIAHRQTSELPQALQTLISRHAAGLCILLVWPRPYRQFLGVASRWICQNVKAATLSSCLIQIPITHAFHAVANRDDHIGRGDLADRTTKKKCRRSH